MKETAGIPSVRSARRTDDVSALNYVKNEKKTDITEKHFIRSMGLLSAR